MKNTGIGPWQLAELVLVGWFALVFVILKVRRRNREHASEAAWKKWNREK